MLQIESHNINIFCAKNDLFHSLTFLLRSKLRQIYVFQVVFFLIKEQNEFIYKRTLQIKKILNKMIVIIFKKQTEYFSLKAIDQEIFKNHLK
ncbi:hypothetical protein SAMN05661044_05208 [Olivibacter domesticus]|uniref:Uncharacterized protein n=1 Tax=Olivibacter domesticus TaxID=407022 RepID=A0A1H7YFB2_OLID1|nr:hypothetical protein SAMN05661044_05208 [Olivibacter domesticus]